MTILIFIYGLIIGSFLNVCIFRLPKEESIAFPPSHCNSCGTSLKWHDLIPVFSYLFQRGRCKYCKESISLQYPMIELLNGIVYLVLFKKFGLSLDFFFFALVFSLLIVVTLVDLIHMIIPDILILFIFLTTIAYKVLDFILYKNSPRLLDSLGGMVLSGLLFFLIIVLSRGGMGEGDLTLIASLGFILGIKSIFLTIFLSFILGAFISIFLLATKIKSRKDPIPFGPFIILAFTITVFWGQALMDYYASFLYY